MNSRPRIFKLKTDSSLDNTAVIIGYVFILVALFLLYFGYFIFGALGLFMGLISATFQSYVLINFQDQKATTFHSLFFISKISRSSIVDLRQFIGIRLYQRTEIVRVTGRGSSSTSRYRQYWVALIDKKGNQYELGYSMNYKQMNHLLMMFKSQLNYFMEDTIKILLESNKVAYEKRKRALFSK